MKIIVAGSRYITDYNVVAQAIAASGWTPTLIIEGGQRSYQGYPKAKIVGGVDWLALQWAIRNGVPHHTEYALWDVEGKVAGPIRNRRMAQQGEALIAIPQGESKGTHNMVLAMTLAGKPIFVYEVKSNEQEDTAYKT